MFNKKTERSDASVLTHTPEATPKPPQASTPPPKAESTPSPPRTSYASPSSGTSAATVLADGCRFKGKAIVSGTIRIEGKAEGDIETADSLVVGKTGDVKAEVKARRAVLNGHFVGKIDANDRVELQTGSDIQADIKAKNMVMEDGVLFSGKCQIGR